MDARTNRTKPLCLRPHYNGQRHKHQRHNTDAKMPRQPVPVGPNISMLLLSSLSSNDVESRMSLAWRVVSSAVLAELRCSMALLGPSGLLPPGVCSVVMPAMCNSSARTKLQKDASATRCMGMPSLTAACRVGQNTSLIFCCLWTKVHRIKFACA